MAPALSLSMTSKPKNMKVIAAAGAGLLAVAVLGYLALISPQKSKAKDLSAQIQTTQQQITAAQLASRAKPVNPRVDDLFRLTKAMPANTDMPGILLELSRVASDTGIKFDSITPGVAQPGSSYQVLPIELVFHGSFYELSDFLFRLRNLVAERDGNLDVGGRLYSVDNVDFSQGDTGTTLSAKLSAKAFVYSAAAAAPAPATAPATPAAPAAAPPAGGATG
jgi:Tfp pilus assembly protein PilO